MTTLKTTVDFLKTAQAIYAGGADNSDEQFVIALIHDARLAHDLLAEHNAIRYKLMDAYRQLEYWWQTEHSCPCGARPESPNTHPHVGGCPTAAALRWAEEAGKVEEAT
jgi:hypothetical protein